MTNKIVVVGSLNMDFVMNTPKIPVIGETISGSDFATVPGGKGANQAAAAAKQGGNVSMIGCLGGDSFGRDMLRSLQENRVDTGAIRILEHAHTGVAMVIVHEGDNMIIVHPGANGELSTQMIDEAESIIRESSLLVLQLEIPLPTAERAIEMANRHGVRVILNPAPALPLEDDFLSKVDVLVLNETECKIITGLEIDGIPNAAEALAALRAKGIDQVIITLGSNGAVYNSGDRIVHIPVHQVEVVDTTAAGDSFIGALSVVLAEGGSIDTAVTRANAAGALAVMKKGAQTSIPGKMETETFLQTQKISLE